MTRSFKSKSLEMFFNPEKLMVYDIFEDDNGLALVIRNNTETVLEGVSLELTLPKDIVAYINDNDDIRDKYTETFILPLKGEKVVYVFLSNESDNDSTELMKVKVCVGNESVEGEVILHVLT